MLSTIEWTAAATDSSELLRRLERGDAQAWRVLSLAVRHELRELAAARLPTELASRLDGSDVVQQTLLEASSSFSAFHGSSVEEMVAWLTSILNNNVNDAVRRHVLAERRSIRNEVRFDDSSERGAVWGAVCAADQISPSTTLAREETHARLHQLLERLPPRQQIAVRRRHLESRSLAEIASELDCSAEAAAQLIKRGLGTLRQLSQNLV